MMTTESVLLDIDSRGVATVTLNRAEKHNAFDDAMIAQLSDFFDRLSNNDKVKAMVLAANGKSFSAGADLSWMKRMAQYSYEQNLADANALADMLYKLHHLPFPTIAKVQGAAFGGAVGLVSCCDMAVGSQYASFCLSEVKLGLLPATISPYVIKAIGERAARRYFVTAERFDSAKAEQLGLLSEAVEFETLDNAVDDLVNRILANGPGAVRASKQLISDVSAKEIDQNLMMSTSKRIAEQRVSDEGQDGLSAFFEKRLPRWAQE